LIDQHHASIRLRDVGVEFRLAYDRQRGMRDLCKDLFRGRLLGARRWHEALCQVDLDIGDGDVVGVIGRNGSGKTTLLRVIGGMLAPSSGSVEVRGRVSALLSIGAGADLQLSGYENIRFQGLLHGLSHERIDVLIPQIAEFAELGEFLDVPMRFYSNGMISRLGFAIVLALEPDILLIDEVLSVGDLAFRRKAESAMDELLSKARCQVIVTHDLSMVRTHCTHGLLLERGRVAAFGDPAEIVDRYEEASQLSDDQRLKKAVRSRAQEAARVRQVIAER
jgi:lipopolysaccharide transport system ATP-binding protein/teichoic acid transport system ATP-binding protein